MLIVDAHLDLAWNAQGQFVYYRALDEVGEIRLITDGVRQQAA